MTFDESWRYQIGISLIKGIGPILARNLISYFGSAEAIFKETPKTLAKVPEIGQILSTQIAAQHNVLERADREIEFLQKKNIQAFYFTDKEYPFRLKECADAPVVLYYKGTNCLNTNRFVGIVGTRNATDYGRELCKNFVSELVSLIPDICIVSGLAYGIDCCAHKAALAENVPTIGALAHGLDKIYPATHRSIATKMIENGGLITEYITETNPDKPNFLQRNRIVAGMCDAIIVAESAVKGGSLVTADLAQSYNRDVFAFPGRIGDEKSEGCNNLIKKNKAALIESATDFIEAMNWEPKNSPKNIQQSLFVELSAEEENIISYIRKNPTETQLNSMANSMNLTISKLSSLLIEMEFKGLLKKLPGNIYRLC